ncbi:MAG: hypothetical protein WA628_09480 [Terriglobales bacterium]
MAYTALPVRKYDARLNPQPAHDRLSPRDAGPHFNQRPNHDPIQLFLAATTAITTAITGFTLFSPPAWSKDDEVNILGPKPGYSPQIGTLVSMLTWMRIVVLRSVKGMSQKDHDHLFDANANTIGALLLHLAATET